MSIVEIDAADLITQQKDYLAIKVFFELNGVSESAAEKIYRAYGNEALKIMQEDPYRPARDIPGIGFITADKIAKKLGFTNDSEARAEAGILYILEELNREGHVFYPWDSLLKKCQEMLGIGDVTFIKAIDRLSNHLKNRRVVVENIEKYKTESYTAIYLAPLHVAETNIAQRLIALLCSPKATRDFDINKAISWVQQNLSIQLAEKQLETVRMACSGKVMVITGGPGTGKTTIINAIIKIYSILKAKIVLAAPTGRAAKKMEEATGREAMTIHRLLESINQKGVFQRDEVPLIDCDLLIVDEASMIDTLLMHNLLKVIPVTSAVIMVGDINQLPSIGAGNVLNDIIDSGLFPFVRLKEIFRQSQESAIVINAHSINEGILPDLKYPKGKVSDFYFIEQDNPQKAASTIINIVTEWIPKNFGLDPVNDIQVLTAMRTGVVGTNNLNIELQKAMNPLGDGVDQGAKIFKVNDKVMQLKNNYHKDVYNGDIGRIVYIDKKIRQVSVSIDNRVVSYDFLELDELTHAYAVSIHKSQGSEYPSIVIPILTQQYMLLQRNLLYTGVTRAKKLVVIVGTKKAMAIAVKNNKIEERYTLLKQRLIY